MGRGAESGHGGRGWRGGTLAAAHNGTRQTATTLHVEYAERGKEYGILFVFSLFCEYGLLRCVRTHVMYRVNQAEYGIHILVVAPREYVNMYLTHRTPIPPIVGI